MNTPQFSLDQLLENCWSLLFRGTKDKKSPFRTPVLCSTSPDDPLPQARTVVLRKVLPAERSLYLYTDVRSQKITDLQAIPDALWLFYHPRKQIQLRLRATPIIHHQDTLCEEVWRNTPVFARKNYCTAKAPATPLSEMGDGLVDNWEETSQAGYQNFAIIETLAHQLDVLMLYPEPQRRAHFSWNEKTKTWEGTWVVP